MRRVVISLVLLLLAASGSAQDYRYWVSGGGGWVLRPLDNKTGGDVPELHSSIKYGGEIGLRLGEGWLFGVDVSHYKLASNYGHSSSVVLAENFVATRVGGMLHRLMFPTDSRFNMSLGWGGGIMVWKMPDEHGYIPPVAGDKGQSEDYKASELFGSAGLGMHIRIAKPVMLRANWTIDYLTAGGTKFSTWVNDMRPRWFGSAGLSLNFLFGSVQHREEWRSDSAWQSERPMKAGPSPLASVDSDGDGVADDVDKCLATPRGVEVDRYGCPKDTDGDGVPDGPDDCPGTNPAARGRVDIYGCAIDSDFDGIPDYLDSCPNNPVGAQIDEKGCPKDSDGDGVPDGLDDCPNTLPGIPVDRYGCVDASLFSKPMVLRPDYEPGSFEVDGKTKARLEQLARALALLPEIRLEISAFTDDIGNDAANQALTEKRANRIKDYLVVYGVTKDRMTVVGRGESSSIASNQTAEGRAKNRRIEIVFHK